VKRLDPTLDVVFKRLLTHEPPLLRDMIEGVLARPVHGLTILDPDIPGERVGDKRVVLDLRVALDDGSRADLEMQARTTRALPDRLIYYVARDYVGQLSRGQDYERLTPTVGIAWLVEPLVPAVDRLHSIFELRERETHVRLSDRLAIHVLQLSSLSPCHPSGYDGQVERWARFFTARDDAELDQLASEDPMMSLAKQTLEQISDDPTMQRLARERADELQLYQMDLAASRDEGRTEGEAKLLLKVLRLRFGRASEAMRARVEAATSEQLDAWTERVLSASALHEVFVP
jgi:predicted transposase/invertase (TIGR01784 family)